MSYLLRPAILAMRPYPPGKPVEEVQRELGLTDVVKLASNENPYGPSPAAVEAAKAAAGSMNLYPDGRGFALKQALARKFDIAVDKVVIGAGSDDIIGILGQMFLQPGTELVMADPSFLRYEAAAGVNAATLVKVPVDPDWRHDLDAMARAVNDRTRLVFMANPNNPTGTTVAKAEIERFLDGLPGHVLTVLDEAYFEFGQGSPGHFDGLDLLKAGKRVAVLRTFSKAYGLAGIRVGYGFMDPEIVRAFNAARPPFHVSAPAQVAALAALDDFAHIERTVALTKIEMKRLSQELQSRGVPFIPGRGNFVCIETGPDSDTLAGALLRQGVIVRPGAQLGMPHHIRVSIGTAEEMDRFLRAFDFVKSSQQAVGVSA
ncbi:MAG: histidinol-phosphate transaminase [Armatimonadetes bacterium]|nr:histidinol-phosphate transaminase [Armatimonadota bacterium]